MKIEWNKAFRGQGIIDPQKCGERIMLIWEQNKQVNSEDLVKDADCANSPFRDYIFRDNDTVAAYKHRLSLANDILRHIELVDHDEHGNKVSTRLVENLEIVVTKGPVVSKKKVYVPITEITKDPDMMVQLIESINATIEEYQRKRSKLLLYAQSNETARIALDMADNKIREITEG